jgi:hypothetical protein
MALSKLVSNRLSLDTDCGHDGSSGLRTGHGEAKCKHFLGFDEDFTAAGFELWRGH